MYMCSKKNFNKVFLFGILVGFLACQSTKTGPDNMTKIGDDPNKIWSLLDKNTTQENFKDKKLPNKYQLLSLNMQKAKLRLKPLEPEERSTTKINLTSDEGQIVSLFLPQENGTFSNFLIKNSNVFSADLAKKFPNIRSYSGHKKDDPTTKIRLDLNPFGLYAMITGTGKTVFIRPIEKESKIYICYNKADVNQDNREFYELQIKPGNDK